MFKYFTALIFTILYLNSIQALQSQTIRYHNNLPMTLVVEDICGSLSGEDCRSNLVYAQANRAMTINYLTRSPYRNLGLRIIGLHTALFPDASSQTWRLKDHPALIAFYVDEEARQSLIDKLKEKSKKLDSFRLNCKATYSDGSHDIFSLDLPDLTIELDTQSQHEEETDINANGAFSRPRFPIIVDARQEVKEACIFYDSSWNICQKPDQWNDIWSDNYFTQGAVISSFDLKPEEKR